MITTAMLSSEEVRRQFPALSSGFAYLENAGGSQVPMAVADAVRNHMLSDYVQLGAGYAQSVNATRIVAEAHALAAEFFNAGSGGEAFLGPSTTALVHMLAKAYGEILKPGDEIVIAESNHEANAGAWADLARLGLSVKIWPVDRESLICESDSLQTLLTNRTRIVAMPHVSNIVGRLEDVPKACELAHEVGAHVVVDGVAYAPHRAIDVMELGVDWYVFSIYKVYGPHFAALYGRSEALVRLTGPNHGFIPKDSYPYKWEPGGVSHEACAGFVGLKEYLGFVAAENYSGRSTIEKAFATMETLESPVESRFRDWVSSRGDLKMVGPRSAAPDTVGTVSFLHTKISSDAISAAVDRARLGIRHGNMYAVRLVDALGISRDPGVVRVSAVHYNTVQEIDRLIGVLERFLPSDGV